MQGEQVKIDPMDIDSGIEEDLRKTSQVDCSVQKDRRRLTVVCRKISDIGRSLQEYIETGTRCDGLLPNMQGELVKIDPLDIDSGLDENKGKLRG